MRMSGGAWCGFAGLSLSSDHPDGRTSPHSFANCSTRRVSTLEKRFCSRSMHYPSLLFASRVILTELGKLVDAKAPDVVEPAVYGDGNWA